MFTNLLCVHIPAKLTLNAGEEVMAGEKSRIIHKHFRLDAVKLKRAQKVLEARTETETVERALELAIAEHERSRLVAEANQKFLRSGVTIRDVFGTLTE
jgi:hypothetical protein